MCKEAKADRWIMLIIAGGCMLGLVVIGRWVSLHPVPDAAMALLGAIVGGLITQAGKAFDTVRALWTDERFGKVTDQLATSAPQSGDPQPVVVTNQADQPVPVEDK